MFGAGIAHAAVYGGHPGLLGILADCGWVPDIVLSAELGDAAAVRGSLASDPGLAARFIGATTALHAAAYWGQREVVRLLLEAGAKAVVSQPTRNSFMQELLDAGADAAATATSGPHAGQTAADTALGQGHLMLAAQLDTPRLAAAGPYG